MSAPLYGWSDIDFEALGPVTLAYSPSSRNREEPGVQAIYNAQDTSLYFTFGATIVGRFAYVDAGVLFRVFEVDSLGFSGHWQDGGRRLPSTYGYFCARRLSAK
jgi:hypothetical protein